MRSSLLAGSGGRSVGGRRGHHPERSGVLVVQRPVNNNTESPVLSVDELAQRYGLTRSTVYSWMQSGTAPKSLKIGRYIRFRLTDVLSWEQEREQQPRSDHKEGRRADRHLASSSVEA